MWNVVCLVERGEGKKRKEAFFRVLPPCLFFTKNPFPVRKKQNKPTHTCVHRGWSLTLREVREVSTCRYAHLRKPVNRSHVFSVLHDTCSSGLWHGGERNSLSPCRSPARPSHTCSCPEVSHRAGKHRFGDFRCSWRLVIEICPSSIRLKNILYTRVKLSAHLHFSRFYWKSCRVIV